MTDKDIFDLMQESGGMLEALQKLRPGAWALLHGWRMNAGLAPLAGLIHTIIGDTGAYIRYGRHNPQAIFNIDKLIDTAREFDRRGYTTLQDFVEWVKNISRSEQREAAADMNLPGFQGSVSILTVHKAKGLEYPIVFLPGLNQAARSVTIGPNALVSETGSARRVAIKGTENPLYEDMWKGEDGEQEELRREHQRLLYVAMTRSRDHLIMIGTRPNGKTALRQNAWLDYLDKTLLPPMETGGETGTLLVEYSYPEWRPRSIAMAPQAGQYSAAAGQKRIEVNAQTILGNIAPFPRSAALEWKKATDFIEQDREAGLDSIPLQAGPRIVSPLTRGSVLHRCLEEYSQKGSYDVARIIPEYPDIMAFEKEAIHRFIDDAEAVLSAVLANNDLTWIFGQQPHTYSELPFLYKRGNSLISGIIDRVVIKNGKGFVVDYKAILIENEESLGSWIAHYRPQIQVYCEAVKEIFKLESVEGYLLFLDSNRLERTI
jgi:ATP-dependent helicase/nuclease subunit A